MNTSHWGRVLGPVGLMLLLASAVTLLVSGETWLGHINVFLGLVCIAFYLVTNFGQLNQFASSKGTFFMATTAVTSALVLGALVAANYLAVKNPKSWDLTKNKIFTLSEDTTRTVQGLKDGAQVTAFYVQGEAGYAGFEELFKRYQALNPKFSYSFVDPAKEPMLVKQYNIHEGGPRVVVKVGSSTERVTAPTEEELTNALVKATHATTKKVYFLSGHGEAELDDKSGVGLTGLMAKMEGEGLRAERYSLVNSQGVLKDAALLVIAGPKTALNPGEASLVKSYLDQGGRVLLLVEPLAPTGLDELLREYGVSVDPGMVVDLSSQKLFGSSPFMPVVMQYGDHEITKRFRLQTAFPTATSLTVGAAAGTRNAPLLQTLAASWVETRPEAQPMQQDPQEKAGPLTIGVAATKDTAKGDPATKRSDEARLVVIGDKDFLTNGGLSVAGNGDFALNTLNWLAEQSERISIRPRSREASRVYLTGVQMAGIRFFATELPIALLALGLAIHFNRRAK